MFHDLEHYSGIWEFENQKINPKNEKDKDGMCVIVWEENAWFQGYVLIEPDVIEVKLILKKSRIYAALKHDMLGLYASNTKINLLHWLT